METILHLLPLTGPQQAAFRAAAPNEEHLFFPTNDRRGAAGIPPDWRARATILLGFVPPTDLKTFPRLKWVQSWNAGVDPYLVPGVLPDGVVLTCAAGAYGPAVSEHMLAMLLALYKRLPAYRDQQNTHTWSDLGHVRSLRGETVLVGGTGDIGRHFARLCRALGAKTVIGLHRSDSPVEGFDRTFPLSAADSLLPQADVVALALPHNAEPAGLLDRRRLQAGAPPWTAPPWRRYCPRAICWGPGWTSPTLSPFPRTTPSGAPPGPSSPPIPLGATTTWRSRWTVWPSFFWTT